MALHLHNIDEETKKRFKKKTLSMSKAREIMKHGKVRGHALSKRQKGFFGIIAGGNRPSKMR